MDLDYRQAFELAPIGPFLAACGVTSFTSLSRYLKFLPEGDPAEVRARLRGAVREGSLRP